MGLILVDTSIWVDHLRRPSSTLKALLKAKRGRLHPYVLGEIALGNFSDRPRLRAQLMALPSVDPVRSSVFLGIVAKFGIQGSGLGFVDAHLIATVATQPGLRLWTRDRRLHERAKALSPDAEFD